MRVLTRFQGQNARRFKRWIRSHYAIFASLGKTVCIGVLPVAYTLLTFGQRAFAQGSYPDSVVQHAIDSVLVSRDRPVPYLSERLDAIHAIYPSTLHLPAVETFADLLTFTPGVEARTRGANGAQADIAIRGGSFDQCLVLLNGVDITDAQTGHHNLNIPVRPEFIERVEVLTGPGARDFGAGAFAGAVNIVTKKSAGNEFYGRIAAGQYRTYEGYAQGTLRSGGVDVAAFVGGMASGGYTVNTDLLNVDAMATVSVRLGGGELGGHFGHQAKAFGANAFYSPKYPEQFEALQTTVAALRYNLQAGRFELSTHVGYRGGTDRFELFRDDAPDWYQGHNYHRTHLVTCRAAGAMRVGISKTSVAFTSRYDMIRSNTLGVPLGRPELVPGRKSDFYTKAARRGAYSVSINETLRSGILAVSLGGIATYSTAFRFVYGYGADLGITLPRRFGVRIAANRAFRLPTFTDLYYKSRTQLGDSLLRPETALTCELGVTYGAPVLSVSLDGYYRFGRDIIDWVQQPAQLDRWKATNHARVDAAGGEVSLQWVPGVIGFSMLRAAYAYNHLLSPRGPVSGSAYAFQNLEHRATLSAVCPLSGGIGIRVAAEYSKRFGTYRDVMDGNQEKGFPHRFALDVSVDYSWRALRLFLNVQNVLGAVTIDYPYVPRPGRWIMGGVCFRLAEEG